MPGKSRHLANRRPNWRVIVGFVTILAAVFVLVVYWTVLSISATSNPVGTLLTTIGMLLTGIGVGWTWYGNRQIDEHSLLWEKEEVHATHDEPRCISYPFHLEEQSVIKGNISGEGGPYGFFLAEFFGTEEEMIEITARIRTGFVVRPRTYLKGTGPKEESIGPLTLPPGNYALKFGKYVDPFKAFFSLTKTVRKKPHESLSAVGLTLLQVGIPVLITGLIALGFGAFVS